MPAHLLLGAACHGPPCCAMLRRAVLRHTVPCAVSFHEPVQGLGSTKSGICWRCMPHAVVFKWWQLRQRPPLMCCALTHNCLLCDVLQATHVAEHEEGCLAYELSVSTDDPGSFVIYER